MLFHHRADVRFAEIGLPSRSFSEGWLPGTDSHHHGRLQRAVSYWLDDPAESFCFGPRNQDDFVMTKPLDQCLKDELTDRATVFAPGQGEVLEIKGGSITLKITSSMSNDQLGVYEIVLDPDMVGAQLHFHRYTDETFIVTEGTLAVTHGETMVNAQAGSVIHVPRFTPHAFANESNKPVTLMLIFNPAQNREGFFYGLQQIFNAPNFDAAAFTALNQKYDSYPIVHRTSATK